MSIRVTVDLLPGGDSARAETIGTMRVWREHPQPEDISRYSFQMCTRGQTRQGTGVLHRRQNDVFTLIRNALTKDWEDRTGRTATPTLFDAVPMFDPPLSDPVVNDVAVARGAPETSATAAERAWPKSGTQRHRILEFLALHGPATDDVIAAVLSLSPNTERPRRRELVLGGWVEDSGGTYPLATTGNQAILWRVTDRGREEWKRRCRS